MTSALFRLSAKLLGKWWEVGIEQLLFHSFPRGAAEQHDERGLAILELIFKYGLLITPETVVWRTTPNARAIGIAQKRVCFTALEEVDLAAHGRVFGEFSLAFSRSDLERIGVIPAFYVSRTLLAPSVDQNVGSFLAENFRYIQRVLDGFVAQRAVVNIDGVPMPVDDVAAFFRAFTGMFYPLEDVEEGKDRHYFLQKEWRIVGNWQRNRVPLSRPLNASEASEIAATNPRFFSKGIEMARGPTTVIEQCMIIEAIAGRPIRDAIEFVSIPRRLEAAARDLMDRYGVSADLHLH